MGFRKLLTVLKAKVAGLSRARRINTLVFSGSPVLLRIHRASRDGQPVWSLQFKNGLMLTIGEAGILDYQDRDFSSFMGERDLLNREFLEQLHKIVLKTLVKYLVHPRLEESQREQAAE